MNSKSSKSSFNPWPFSIVGFFGLAIVAAVVWVTFCLGHGTDLVAADYYEQEVEYQTQIDRMERGQSLGRQASIAYDSQAGIIQIQVPREHAVLQPEGFVHLYRPSEANLDRRIPLKVNPAGLQKLEADSLKPGLWDVRVRWTAQGREFFLNEKLRIGVEGL